MWLWLCARASADALCVQCVQRIRCVYVLAYVYRQSGEIYLTNAEDTLCFSLYWFIVLASARWLSFSLALKFILSVSFSFCHFIRLGSTCSRCNHSMNKITITTTTTIIFGIILCACVGMCKWKTMPFNFRTTHCFHSHQPSECLRDRVYWNSSEQLTNNISTYRFEYIS